MHIRLFMTGRNYDFATALPDHLSLADKATLDDALEQLASLLPGGETLPPSCIVAVSGKHCGTLANHRAEVLHDDDELVILAPVAGG